MKDTHVHSNISHDGISTIEEYCKSARGMGVDEITFTEHYDIYDGVDTDLKTIKLNLYKLQFVTLKNRYKNVIDLNYGLEVGLQPDINVQEKIKRDIRGFDFVIGSSHITCKKDISKDYSFFEGLSRHEAYLKYFEEVLENIKTYDNEFDVYGHLDYIVRYGGYKERIIDYDEFKDILDAILTELIRKDKGLEINTSAFRYGLPFTHPNPEILRRYKELGGKIITIGSDAHKVEDLAKDFDVACSVAKGAGFDEAAIFHKRKPDFVKINSLKPKWKR